MLDKLGRTSNNAVEILRGITNCSALSPFPTFFCTPPVRRSFDGHRDRGRVTWTKRIRPMSRAGSMPRKPWNAAYNFDPTITARMHHSEHRVQRVVPLHHTSSSCDRGALASGWWDAEGNTDWYSSKILFGDIRTCNISGKLYSTLRLLYFLLSCQVLIFLYFFISLATRRTNKTNLRAHDLQQVSLCRFLRHSEMLFCLWNLKRID